MKKAKKPKKNPEWDDGRVVANMNVPGMPWYTGKRNNASGNKNIDENNNNNNNNNNKDKSERPANGESMNIILGGMGAALIVGLIFCAGIILFVFLCVTFL